MVFLTIVIQLFALLMLTSKINGTLHSEEIQDVMISSIIKELSGISKTACALRCKRSNECEKAAIQRNGPYFVCLHLNKSTNMEEGKKITVTVLHEFKIDDRSKCCSVYRID